MFSKIFIERPRFAAVVSLVIFLAGMICLLRLPVEEYPEIAPPSVRVSASYTGASAETVRDVIATPLDAVINGVEDMLYFSSTCSARVPPRRPPYRVPNRRRRLGSGVSGGRTPPRVPRPR